MNALYIQNDCKHILIYRYLIEQVSGWLSLLCHPYLLTEAIAFISRSSLHKYYMAWSYPKGVANGEDMVESVRDEWCDEWCIVYMAAFNLDRQILLVFSQGSWSRNFWPTIFLWSNGHTCNNSTLQDDACALNEHKITTCKNKSFPTL